MTQRRLLFYTHALVGGGAERVWARLASGFAARGDCVDFVVDFEASANLPFLSKDVRLRVLPKGHAAATRELSRMLRAERPDASLSAISVSNLKHAVAAMLAGRRDRAIISYHGFYESEPERLSNISYRLTRPLCSAVGGAVAVSQSLRADLQARFRVAPERVTTIFNPAAPEPFPADVSSAALAARVPVIVAIGRLVPDKDYPVLLQAFSRLRTKQARLVILGEGPLRGALEAQARELGIEDRVSMRGFVADVGAEMASARCFVMASRRESFGLACVEALSHGLPCVVTDCGGPPEIVDDAALGAVVAVGDADALARAIDAQLAAPGDPAPRQARAKAFTLDAALDAYDALIGRVIAHARTPSSA
jgi:glycosyltransferase involved in cell wall biosynthesis